MRFGVRVPNLALVGNANRHQLDGVSGVAFFVEQAEIPGAIPLAAPVAYLAGDGQALLVVLYGPLHLSQVAVGLTQVIQTYSFIAPVVYLAGDGQGLFAVLYGPLHLPQVAVGAPQVAQVIPLAAPVAYLAGDGQCLFVILEFIHN